MSGAGEADFRGLLLARFRWVDGHADVARLFADADVLAGAGQALGRPFAEAGVTKVAAVEARGFVIGAAVALSLRAGFVPIRKPGSVHPGPQVEVVSAPDWRGRATPLRLQREALGEDDCVLVVDDWAETGSQASAARSLVEAFGARYAGLSLLVDELSEEARARLDPVRAVVRGKELPAGG